MKYTVSPYYLFDGSDINFLIFLTTCIKIISVWFQRNNWYVISSKNCLHKLTISKNFPQQNPKRPSIIKKKLYNWVILPIKIIATLINYKRILRESNINCGEQFHKANLTQSHNSNTTFLVITLYFTWEELFILRRRLFKWSQPPPPQKKGV